MLRFCVLSLVILMAPRAWAQGPGFGLNYGTNEAADQGLQSATPTDNIDELDSATSDEGEYGLGNVGGDYQGNDLFSDDAVSEDDFFGGGGGLDGGNDYSMPSAFGAGDTDPGAVPSTNAKPSGKQANAQSAPATNFGAQSAPIETLDTQVVEPPPAQAAPSAQYAPAGQYVNPAPVNQVPPANAVAPMTPVNQAPPPMNATGGIIQGPEAAEVPPADPAQPTEQDQELMVESEPTGPVAPPLPPPNEFSGAPPVPGTLRIMAEGEAPEEYQVEPGDTLFDICDQLLDEPTYWPKLWALNPEIKNPHFIFPGMKLRFYPGDDETPPYLQVVAEEDVIPIDKGNLDESQLVVEPIQIPEDVIEEYAIEVIGPAEVEMPDDFFDNFFTSGRTYRGSDILVQVPGFIYADEREPLGYVIGGAAGEHSVGEGRKALIERSGNLAAGSTYTILRPRGEVQDPETGDWVGYRYDFVANVRITNAVDGDVVVGEVTAPLLSVYPEDIVVSYISTTRTVPAGDVGAISGSAAASIVGFSLGGSDVTGQAIGGTGGFAFIDKGSGDGITTGMNLPVYQTPGYLDSFFGTSDLPEDYQMIGVIRIIDTTDAGAVGYIVKNTRELRIGDRAGQKGG